MPARQRGSRRGDKPEGTQENPVILKTEKKKDNGKKCDYCIAKGWKGLNHVESECYTKKREEKKEGKSKKAKGEESDNEDGVSICYVKVKGANAIEPVNHFEYDTGTSHHTTNRIDLLQNTEDIHMEVEAHDKTISICKKRGTLVCSHNGEVHHLKNCLYDPSYSNLVSGQRTGSYSLEVEGKSAILKEKGKEVFKMQVDSKGAMWIKIESLKGVRGDAKVNTNTA